VKSFGADTLKANIWPQEEGSGGRSVLRAVCSGYFGVSLNALLEAGGFGGKRGAGPAEEWHWSALTRQRCALETRTSFERLATVTTLEPPAT